MGRPPTLGQPGRIHRMAELAMHGVLLMLGFAGTAGAPVDDASARIVLTGTGAHEARRSATILTVIPT